MCPNERVIITVGSAIKDQRKRESGEGAELLPEEGAGGCLPERPHSVQMGTERCLEYNKPEGKRHGRRQK